MKFHRNFDDDVHSVDDGDDEESDGEVHSENGKFLRNATLDRVQ